MTQFTMQMDAELAKPAATIFGAIEILLPGYALRLVDGAAVLSFGGEVFSGRDPTFGTLDSIDPISDGSGDTAPEISVTLLPASDASSSALAAADMQGSQIALWLGAINPDTGSVIPDPYLLFLGELDVPTLEADEHTRQLLYSAVSVFERFFQGDEGQRLSPTWHESVWPGEKGFSAVTGVENPVYWGTDAPAPTVSTVSQASVTNAVLKAQSL
jgi:hypothetical protein